MLDPLFLGGPVEIVVLSLSVKRGGGGGGRPQLSKDMAEMSCSTL